MGSEAKLVAEAKEKTMQGLSHEEKEKINFSPLPLARKLIFVQMFERIAFALFAMLVIQAIPLFSRFFQILSCSLIRWFHHVLKMEIETKLWNFSL